MYTSDSGTLVAVTARHLCERPLPEQVKRLAAAGFGTVILREKDLSEYEYMKLAEQVKKACEKCRITLAVHNFPKCVEKLGIELLHMPLSGLNEELCRRFRCGASVHSLNDAVKAVSLGAEYLVAGHIFATDCKKVLPPRGLDFLREICCSVDVPVYAIGGITPENAHSCVEAGASGVCVMSGAMKL